MTHTHNLKWSVSWNLEEQEAEDQMLVYQEGRQGLANESEQKIDLNQLKALQEQDKRKLKQNWGEMNRITTEQQGTYQTDSYTSVKETNNNDLGTIAENQGPYMLGWLIRWVDAGE